MYNFTRFHTTLVKNGMCSSARHSSGQFVDVSNRESRKGKREKFKRCSQSEPISYETTHHVGELAKSTTTKNALETSKTTSAEGNSKLDDRSYIINVFLKNQQASKDGSINIRVRDANVNPEDISLEELTKNIQQNYSTMDKICKSSLADLETRDNKLVFVKKFERLWCDVFRLSKMKKVEANVLNAVRADEIVEKVRKDEYAKESVAKEGNIVESAEENREELADLTDSRKEATEEAVVSSRTEETANESVRSERRNKKEILSEDFENTINSKASVISSEQANEGDLENKRQYDPEVASTRLAKRVKEQTSFEDSENEIDPTFSISDISNEQTNKETAKRLKSTSEITGKRHENLLFDDSEHGIGKEAGLGTSKSDKEVSERIAIEEKEQTPTEKELLKEEEEFTKDDHPVVSSTKIDDVEYDAILARNSLREGEENLKNSSKIQAEKKIETHLKRMDYSDRENLNSEPILDEENLNLKENAAIVSSTKINEAENEEVLVRDEENSNKISSSQTAHSIPQDSFDPEPVLDQSKKATLEKTLVEEQIENAPITLAKGQAVKSKNEKSLELDEENIENDAVTLGKDQMVKSKNEKSLEQDDENIENDAITLAKDRMVKSRNEISFKQNHENMKSTVSTIQLNQVANKTMAPDIVMEDEIRLKTKTFPNRMTYPVLQENLDPEPIQDQTKKISLEKALVMDQIKNNKNTRAREPVIDHSTKRINDNKEKTVVNKYLGSKKRILNPRPNNLERIKRLNGRNKKQVENVIKLASPPQPETTLGKITNFCKGLFKSERIASEKAEATKEDNFVDRTMQPKKLCIPQKNAFDMQYRFLAPPRNEVEYKTDNLKPRKRRVGSMETITNDAVFQEKCGVRERILSTRSGKFRNGQKKPQYSTQYLLNETFNNAKETSRDSERKRWYSSKGSCREDGDGKASSETEVVCETNRCETPKDIEDIQKGVSGATSKCLAIRNPDKPAEPFPMEEPCDDKDECDPRWQTVVKPVEPTFDIMDHIGNLADNDPTGDIQNYYGKNGYKNLEYYKYRPCSYYDMIQYMAKKRNPQPSPFCDNSKHEDEESC